MLPTHASLLQFSGIRLDGATLILAAHSGADSAPCPSCGVVSRCVHARYHRRPMDLPWRGGVVRLDVTVRRFACRNRACPHATFAEAFGPTLPRRAQRTAEVDALLRQVAQATGGRAGARLAGAVGLPVSRDTLVRLLRDDAAPDASTPRVLGVDDLALRRGRTYATLLVDLETHDPIDLLAGREAQVLATWLAAHPGVEVIVRDRAGAYAEGATQGAPHAVQVADRFHLVQNVTAALDELVRQRRWTPPEEPAPATPEPAPDPVAAPPPAPAAPPKPPSASQQLHAQRRGARRARWERVRGLQATGCSVRAIARELGMHRRTVRRLLDSTEPPRNQIIHPRPGGFTSPLLIPSADYVQARWRAGCTNAAQLFREIVPMGYRGSRTLLIEAVRSWRPPRLPKVLRQKRGQRYLDQRKLRRLITGPPEHLTDEEQAVLRELLSRDPVLATGHTLVQRFRKLLKEGDVAKLAEWLADARESRIASFVGFAHGIQTDRAAVEAAITTDWSTGMVEGHVHRVKLLKRLGYGRAKLDLLRRRVVAA